MAERSPKKPSGQTGPISLGGNGPRRHLVKFPTDKAKLELMIAELFVNSRVLPNNDLRYFSNLKPNPENDLDFTVDTGLGKKLLELAEFAPLDKFKTSYDRAPPYLTMSQFCDFYLELINKKSNHQGGRDRLLLTYKTHSAFFVSLPVIEVVRRQLSLSQPKFERVYFLSPHDETDASTWEVFPGRPHAMFEKISTEDMLKMQIEVMNFDDIPLATE
ncbi:hypothetical protein [Methylocystis heyeri]|uniref:Uncharacterized protein n=1 Tax=Methylocystis heyeri TaxID=391905 RepID=A0A6B8KI35_9HYPH|nr:hypothetical protein [Methylocystis heyeri]QGM46671.1 hypothetical protein H2LOC_013745 [Methylocystis heyeri]